MKHIKLFENFINEKSIDFEKKLKAYLDGDVSSYSNTELTSVFAGIDINDLIKKDPEIFKIPKKYTPTNMYFYRGFAISLKDIKQLGPFKDKETTAENEYLVSYDQRFNADSILSFSVFEKVAVGFAEYSSDYIDEKSFDPKVDNIPVVLAVKYSQYKNDFFGNPDALGKIGKHGNEGEVFFKGKSYIADVMIPTYIEKYLV